MPQKARRPCKHPGCPNLVATGEIFCPVHAPSHKDDYARKHPEHFRLYNNKRWRRYRMMYLREHPLCVSFAVCKRAASVVDHIKDHDGDWALFWEPTNHQPMCAHCHNTKTAKTKGWGRKQMTEGEGGANDGS